jgi:hypothetical protein
MWIGESSYSKAADGPWPEDLAIPGATARKTGLFLDLRSFSGTDHVSPYRDALIMSDHDVARV